jgi:hypothetical protein
VLNKGEIGFYKDAKNTATPYNNEPMLNLGHCHCDVTLGYKKKKNVFTLKLVLCLQSGTCCVDDHFVCYPQLLCPSVSERKTEVNFCSMQRTR